ncbi:hypothetical protein B9Z19DRAFT_1106816 [Tuber borchii]|uniref:Uncharacterized protein n=1 Tax=Tuber borchii TaxID=42251 RepID=A0A2T6ZZF2_TUBBO|nr:hypothetical protein B9Z19DRAFT_1106816 [Tuber borchii]
MSSKKAVSFQFSHIGNDSGAAELLISLDKDPDLGEYISLLPCEFDLEGELDHKWFVLSTKQFAKNGEQPDRQDNHNHTEVPNLLTNKERPKGAGYGSEWEDSE